MLLSAFSIGSAPISARIHRFVEDEVVEEITIGGFARRDPKRRRKLGVGFKNRPQFSIGQSAADTKELLDVFEEQIEEEIFEEIKQEAKDLKEKLNTQEITEEEIMLILLLSMC